MATQLQSSRRNFRLSYDLKVFLLALLAGFPAVVVALWLVWSTPESGTWWRWGLTVLVPGFWLVVSIRLQNEAVRPLQTTANLLSGVREGDFSVCARGSDAEDSLGAVFYEINSLIDTLREQRLGALEATALLLRVMAEIEVALFAFDESQRLRLVNRFGERLLDQTMERMLGRTAEELGLGECLLGESQRTVQVNFPGAIGRWGMRRSVFRQRGRPHQLLVLADLSRVLREEERQAWQRLVRVLGHELNNSLAPIKSIAGSLKSLVNREALPADWKTDLNSGLEVVAARADALNRFMSAYAQFARLPPPRPQSVDVPALIRRVAGLETRLPVAVTAGPELSIQADADQLEQLLINLVRNAVEAVLESTGGRTGTAEAQPPNDSRAPVQMAWSTTATYLEIRVEDHGAGLPNTANLFVPFFTTKPKGSGIGLVLCRQIAEAHRGLLTLDNRPGGPGCLARLRLPLVGTPRA